ncbi:Regulator of chromosome condensation RCC1 [Arabidopsis thaliana x Arabidopsis arenosa]|uniref:Regulator of chromosome condensation RCC1 n=1 Tax=Arabidopsis thaliana x Arabidopsis arenosa TaxID=1240361 RepID=A0A8T1ZNH1_9BRAS|nr:Regulator of chromosome condensation RCC1 [Arabidopsis thaliana x Arabidopsis arenosa]
MNGEANLETGVHVEEEEVGQRVVYMWGYLPGASSQRSPLISPVEVKIPPAVESSWKDVSGGGCGFAMATAESGKLITWGSTDDLGQSYVTSGKHGETPQPFPLPPEVCVQKAEAGWAHCVAVTENQEVYTWGWRECIPTGRVFGQVEGDSYERNISFSTEQVSPSSQGKKSSCGTSSQVVARGEPTKKRRISPSKQAAENASQSDNIDLSALPCLVSLAPGVRIVSVAAGGRHTLALSDIGQVWGWGYGGEGQLGLGSRVRLVSSPHPIPCIEPSSYGKATSSGVNMSSEVQCGRVLGSYVKRIACGGRHSAVITDTGALLTFGWGLYGQCGQGSTDDELSPTCVSSLLGIRIEEVAAGLWHTICASSDGDVYSFGGNQFGQLGTGFDQAETLPKLLEAPNLENVNVKIISCGARHTAVIADEGKVFCWGWNKYGQLGLGDVIDRNAPAEVRIKDCVPKNIACGWWHTLLLGQSSL